MQRLTSSVPQTLRLKCSASLEPAAPRCLGALPIPPTPAGQIFPSPSPHTPARFAQDRSHPVAAAQETIPLPARFPPSVSRAAPPAIARSVLLQHKPLHGGHSPIARFLKTNAHPHQSQVRFAPPIFQVMPRFKSRLPP